MMIIIKTITLYCWFRHGTRVSARTSSPDLIGRSRSPRPFDSLISVSGILGRPVPSTPRLRRACGLRPAEALAKAASRAVTVGDGALVLQAMIRIPAARIAPELLCEPPSMRTEGAGNAGCAVHP